MQDTDVESEVIEGQISKPQLMALKGIRVVDLTVAAAGPYATKLLGQLGAEILKIELPGVGDQTRRIQRGPFPPGTPPLATINPVWEDISQNKQSVTIDLHKEKGQEILHRLVEKSDVFTSNILPPALKKFQADYKTLSKYNPKLVYVRGSVFGPNGPDADNPGLADFGSAISGLMTLQSQSTGEPAALGASIPSTVHALVMAYAVLAALLARDRLGIGQEVTLSQIGSIMNLLLGNSVASQLVRGETPRVVALRKDAPAISSWYKCKDGKWMMLAAMGAAAMTARAPVATGNPHSRFDDWHRICVALGTPDLENDPRFKDPNSQLKNNKALMKILEDVFSTRTRAEWDASFRNAGVVWFCRINELSDLASDPQVLANNYVWDLDHPKYGRIKLPGHPATFTKTPATLRSFAPELGEHTNSVLAKLLGYSQAELTELKGQGII